MTLKQSSCPQTPYSRLLVAKALFFSGNGGLLKAVVLIVAYSSAYSCFKFSQQLLSNIYDHYIWRKRKEKAPHCEANLTPHTARF